MHSSSRYLDLAFSLLLAVAPLTAQNGINDLFNRADNASLGPDWTEPVNGAEILQNRLHSVLNWQVGWAYHNRFTANYQETVVRATFTMGGGVGDFVGLSAGLQQSTWGVTAKIRDNNGDGLADIVSFHPANNTTFYIGTTSFFNIPTPIPVGIATLSFRNGGDTAHLELRDLNGQNQQVFSTAGVHAILPVGVQVGLVYVGDVTIDDFQAFTGSPDVPALTASPMRVGQSSDILLTGATPNAPLLLGLSITGGISVPTPLGTLGIAPPVFFLGVPPADNLGRLSIPIGNVPHQLLGLQMWLQALDLATPALSSYVSTTPF